MAWVALGRAAIESALPQSAQEPLGLALMGAAVGDSWTAHEAEQFEEGLLLFGRDFPAIRKQFLPQRETEHLVLYYYNVWKTQSSTRAQEWYQRLEQVGCKALGRHHACLMLFQAFQLKSHVPSQTACAKLKTLRYTLWAAVAYEAMAELLY